MTSFYHNLSLIEILVGTIALFLVSAVIAIFKRRKETIFRKENLVNVFIASILWIILCQLFTILFYSGGSKEEIIELEHQTYIVSFIITLLGFVSYKLYACCIDEQENRKRNFKMIITTIFITITLIIPINLYLTDDEGHSFDTHSLMVRCDDFPINISDIDGAPEVIYSEVTFGPTNGLALTKNFIIVKDYNESTYSIFGDKYFKTRIQNEEYSFSLRYWCVNESIIILDDDNEINGTFTYSEGSGYLLKMDIEDEEAVQHVSHGPDFTAINLKNHQSIDIRISPVFQS